MRNFIVIDNEGYGEQKGLYELYSDELDPIMIGDYYHDKISKKIEGFTDAALHFGHDFNLKIVTIESLVDIDGNEEGDETDLYSLTDEQLKRIGRIVFGRYGSYPDFE